MKVPGRSPGPRPLWWLHALCVFLCIPSLMHNENPIRSETSVREQPTTNYKQLTKQLQNKPRNNYTTATKRLQTTTTDLQTTTGNYKKPTQNLQTTTQNYKKPTKNIQTTTTSYKKVNNYKSMEK